MLTFSLVFAWTMGICYGFVLISSAAGANHANLYQIGEAHHFDYNVNVLLNEIDDESTSKNVGFELDASVVIAPIWSNGQERALKVELGRPRLSIRSRKAPTPEGFIGHTSKLDELAATPFYLHWQNGVIDGIYLTPNEPLALANLKKGLASLLQFQLLDLDTHETDASGNCHVTYRSLTPHKFEKTKLNCRVDGKHATNRFLRMETASKRRIVYELAPKFDRIESVMASEVHKMAMGAREDLGSVVETKQKLVYVKSAQIKAIKAISFEHVVKKSGNYGREDLMTTREVFSEDGGDFVSVLSEVRSSLQDKHVGSLQAAKAFLKLLNAARTAKIEVLAKVVAAKKNEKILGQIYEVLAFVQTPECHEVVMKRLHFDREEHADLSEKYLWALSLAPRPSPEIVQNLENRYKKAANIPAKVKETLLLTITAMADVKSMQSITEMVTAGLEYAKTERGQFLRALKNLKNPTTIPLLLDIIANGTQKEAVLAFKALKAFNPADWNENVTKAAFQTLFQLRRKHDSSARTIAADILLESGEKNDFLPDLVDFLRANETSFEVKQYVFQRMRMISDDNGEFRARVDDQIKNNSLLNNYAVLAPKGLSTAFKRSFMRSDNLNGSLVTIQEMAGGIVKRGLVNVVLDKNGHNLELFSLGIFAGGLGSLVSSGSEDGEPDEEEAATAGMDLTVLGRQLRPFVFFSGQGELMGHVWSGTGSERTSAFQSTMLLQDHSELVRLGSGFVAELVLQGAVSFDLAGKIEISIWSRTADSLVEKTAGVAVNGVVRVDSSFVRSQIEFVSTIEPKLSLKSDIDFGGNMKLCMRVTQPESVYRHNVFKIERIPGSKHKLRIAKYRKMAVPGVTHALNRKNNEMCGAMFD